MYWRLTALSAFLCLAILIRDFSHLEMRHRSVQQGPRLFNSTSDPESLLSQGEKLPLRCVSAVDLELIPGVTERLAERLLEAARRLETHARKYGTGSALQEVKGIGPKTGQSLSRLLTFEGECERLPGGPGGRAGGISRGRP